MSCLQRWLLFSATLFGMGVIICTANIVSAQDKLDRTILPIQAPVLPPITEIETRRLGTLEFKGDYATEETAAKLRQELKFQAATQTYLWSFPIANVISLRDGLRAVGIGNTTIPIYEDYLTPKTVVPTGNQSTIYAYNVLTLGDEPMVLNVIPDVVGFIGDAWQRPQMDLPVNDDGSIDLYFGPTPPPQGEKSWVKTKPGEGFFM